MKQRLAAILAADMVGYSRLMRADEMDTYSRQAKLLRSVIEPAIETSRGRLVKTTGDGFLVEFSSVLDAVKCAVGIQDSINSADETETPEKRIRFRMGVNLGDVIADGNDIIGDGVNIAARLESIADPGGLCISDQVYQSIRSQPDLCFEDMGEQNVKNIPDPIRAWRWITDGPRLVDSMQDSDASRSANKPSIAVLPFNNMSGDPEQEYFADGMAEDIITELSKMPWFFVTARNSSFVYKGQSVDIKRIGQELGVAYVLEGSIRKAGNRLRINAQLIDAATNNHVWADRYDREITDIFDIQDEMTAAIIAAVAPEFVSAEISKARHKSTDQLDAWECVMRGRALVWKFGRDDAHEAKTLFEKAIRMSPNQQLGLGDLALVHFLDAFYNWSGSREVSLDLMQYTARRGLEANSSDVLAWTIMSWAHLFALEWDEAIVSVNRAISLSPSFAPAIGIKGAILACNDEPDLAIPLYETATRLSPHDPFRPFWLMGVFWAYHSLQDYESALRVTTESTRIAPDNPTFWRQHAVANHMVGNTQKCQEALERYLEIAPDAVAEDVLFIPARNKHHLQRYVDLMLEIGVPRNQ